METYLLKCKTGLVMCIRPPDVRSIKVLRFIVLLQYIANILKFQIRCKPLVTSRHKSSVANGIPMQLQPTRRDFGVAMNCCSLSGMLSSAAAIRASEANCAAGDILPRKAEDVVARHESGRAMTRLGI
jgi:hypothetical protein